MHPTTAIASFLFFLSKKLLHENGPKIIGDTSSRRIQKSLLWVPVSLQSLSWTCSLSWKSPHRSLHDTIALLISSISSNSSQSLCSFLSLYLLLKYHCSLSFNHLCPVFPSVVYETVASPSSGPGWKFRIVGLVPGFLNQSTFEQDSQGIYVHIPGWEVLLSLPLLILRISPKRSHLPLQLSSVPIHQWYKCASPAQLSLLSSLHVYGFCLFFVKGQSHEAYGILMPWPGIKPMPPAVEVRHLDHWTTREVPLALL